MKQKQLREANDMQTIKRLANKLGWEVKENEFDNTVSVGDWSYMNKSAVIFSLKDEIKKKNKGKIKEQKLKIGITKRMQRLTGLNEEVFTEEEVNPKISALGIYLKMGETDNFVKELEAIEEIDADNFEYDGTEYLIYTVDERDSNFYPMAEERADELEERMKEILYKHAKEEYMSENLIELMSLNKENFMKFTLSYDEVFGAELKDEIFIDGESYSIYEK